MRLIDADALGMDMWIQMGIVYGEDIGKSFADIVRNAPTIDAEPVVRCKECIYYRPADVICEIFNDSTGLSKLVQPDDYCSYGERREP